MKQTGYGFFLYVVLAISPVRLFMESSMIMHMLVQITLLIVVGWLFGDFIIKMYESFFNKWNSNGIAGIIIFLFVMTYWMIPRKLDEALTVDMIELFKFISLPIAGFLLKDSWKRLQTLGKSFIYLNFLSMFGLLAWLYIDSPIQICNSYLENQQKMLGWGLLTITITMTFYIVQVVFTDHSEDV